MPIQTPIDKHKVLSSHSLFKSLKPDEIDKISALVEEQHFENGEIIFLKGDKESGMMIIIQGKVMISATSSEGKEIALNVIESGGIIGEIALLDGKPRSANAKAIEACILLSIRCSKFVPFLKTHSDVSLQLMKLLCEKLRNTSDMMEDLGMLPIEARLSKFIFKLATTEINPGCIIRLKLSQQEIANLIGTSREKINRTFAQWQSQGLINLHQQKLTINNPNELILIALNQCHEK